MRPRPWRGERVQRKLGYGGSDEGSFLFGRFPSLTHLLLWSPGLMVRGSCKVNEPVNGWLWSLCPESVFGI